MKQKIVTGKERWDFDKEVSQFLSDGWKVVPGTLLCSVAATSVSSGYSSDTRRSAEIVERWAVVLEK